MDEASPQWVIKRVDEICDLGRGRVISQEEIRQHPGVYPVFSSQSKDEGVFGFLDTHDFEGDYVTWTTDGANAGTVFFRTGRFNCTNVCGTLKPKSSETNARFLARALSTITKRHVSYVGNPKLMNNTMAAISLRMPPKSEQDIIAAVLDTVDEAIAKTEAVIAKLKQVRAGMLHDLLARGLDEYGQLRNPITHPEQFKDSPLGRIPKEWEIGTLVSRFFLPQGQVDPKVLPYSEWILVAPDHIEPGTGRLLTRKTAREQGAISGKYVFEAGDVVYSKIRPYLRKAILAVDGGLCSADMYPLRPKPGVISQFLLAVVLGESFSRFASAVSMRSGFPKINREELSEFITGWPQSDEQSRIASVLIAFSEQQSAIERELAKLYQLKSGLMADLLTGRVRVPENIDLTEARP